MQQEAWHPDPGHVRRRARRETRVVAIELEDVLECGKRSIRTPDVEHELAHFEPGLLIPWQPAFLRPIQDDKRLAHASGNLYVCECCNWQQQMCVRESACVDTRACVLVELAYHIIMWQCYVMLGDASTWLP
jgi:hypothetical protein